MTTFAPLPATPSTRTLRTRALARQAAIDTLDSLTRWPWQPLEHDATSDRPTWIEWETARLDDERHGQQDPSWAFGWPRPSTETSEVLWALMGYGDDDWRQLCGVFPRPQDLTVGERGGLAARTKQALCVALRSALQAARQRRLFTRTDLWDALGACWSPAYRHVTLTTPAQRLYQMKASTFYILRRDLQCAQVDVEKLWRVLVGASERLRPFTVERQAKSGYTISTDNVSGKAQRRLLRLVEAALDADPCMALDEGPLRLLLASDRDTHPIPHHPLWPAKMSERVRGERAHNLTSAGPRGTDMLTHLASAAVLLDADAFLSDWRKAKRRAARIEHLLMRDYALADVDENGESRELKRLLSVRPIKYTGGQLKAMQREYKAAHGWTHKQTSATFAALGVEVDRWNVQTTEREAQLGKLCAKRFADKPVAWVQQEKVNILTRLDEWDRAHWIETNFSGWARRLRTIKRPAHLPKGCGWYVETVSDYTRTVNGRWQALHGSPAAVSPKPKYAEWDEEVEETAGQEAAMAGLRLRWFKAPAARDWWRVATASDVVSVQDLVSVDVSSSQVQLIALVSSNDALYAAACDATDPSKPGFKHTLAAAAWAHVVQGESGYAGVDDERLLEMVKNFFMRFIYGSKPHRIISDHAKERITYGPGFVGDTLKEKMASATSFLHAVPGGKDLENFLNICRRMAAFAMERDPYVGLSFHNPYDDAVVRWNPPTLEKAVVSYGRSGVLELQQPAGAQAVIGTWAGDYPVDGRKLEQMTAPCLVHMWDGLFSALVIEALLRRGITTFSAIHDCWMIPAMVMIGGQSFDGRDVLRQAVAEAIRAWHGHLKGVYLDLLAQAGTEDDYWEMYQWFGKWLHGQGVLDPAMADLPRHPFWQTWPSVRVKETPERS